jgi:hypothetical protein
MIQLSNAASALLAEALRVHQPAEFGFRFQSIVCIALRRLPQLDDLGENTGAGHPDLRSQRLNLGIEVKAVSSDTISFDTRAQEAIARGILNRLVVIWTHSPPFPVWVTRLSPPAPTSVWISESMPIDAELEPGLGGSLSELLECVGHRWILARSPDPQRLTDRERARQIAEEAAAQLGRFMDRAC